MLVSSALQSTAPEGSQSAASEAKLQEDLNRFLTLLVTQLQNQDPLDPLKANEFTSQLVQFASVEQQIYQNSNLEKLLAVQSANQVSSMVNFIGKTIESPGQTFPLENGKGEFAYDMPAGANSATITITNSDGLTVYHNDANTDAGAHTFTWDGKNQVGLQQPDGDYTVLVSALDHAGNLLKIAHTVSGRVTGAGVSDGDAYLFMGDSIVVPQDSVLSVKETEAPTP